MRTYVFYKGKTITAKTVSHRSAIDALMINITNKLIINVPAIMIA